MEIDQAACISLISCRQLRNIEAEIVCYIIYDLWRYAPHLARICGNQRILTDRIDEPRRSLGIAIDCPHGPFRKQPVRVSIGTCDLQAAPNVSLCLFLLQSVEAGSQGDSLFELSEFDRVQFLIKFWLAYQYNLQ